MVTLTIDEERGVYIVERDGGTEVIPYRSKKSARIAGRFYKSKFGWVVKTVKPVKEKKTMALSAKQKQEQERLWARLLRGVQRGELPENRRQRAYLAMVDAGLLVKLGAGYRVTEKGRTWSEGVLPLGFKKDVGQGAKATLSDNVPTFGTGITGLGEQVEIPSRRIASPDVPAWQQQQMSGVREMVARAQALQDELKRIEAEYKQVIAVIPEEITLNELSQAVALKRTGKTYVAVAQEVGVSIATMRRVEAGMTNLEMDVVVLVCKWLGVKKLILEGENDG